MFYVVDHTNWSIMRYESLSVASQAATGKWLFATPRQLFNEAGGLDQLKTFLKIIEAEDVPTDPDELTEFAFVQIIERVGTILKSPKRSYLMASTPKVTPAKTVEGKVSPDDVITITKDFAGPSRRPGSNVAKIFDCYKDGMTVSNFLAASKKFGGSVGNIRKDEKMGRISIKKAS